MFDSVLIRCIRAIKYCSSKNFITRKIIDTNCQFLPLLLHHETNKEEEIMTTFYYNRKKFNCENAQVASLEDIRSSIASCVDEHISFELVCDEYSSRYLASDDAFQYVVMCRVYSGVDSSCFEYLVGCCDELLS